MSKSPFALIACVALVACSGGKDDSDGVTTPPENCATYTVAPADGATNAYYRGTLEFAFSAADSSAEVSLSQGGTDVPGSSAWFGNTLVFTPTNALNPSTAYTWDLGFCEGGNSATGGFTTSAVGAEVSDAGLADTTYLLNVASGTFLQPPNVGALIQQYLTVDILVGVVSAGGGDIQMIGALGTAGATPPAQSICYPTIDFPPADFDENPYFEVGPRTTTVTVQGVSVTIEDLFISGAFAPDGSAIAGAVLAGEVDTRSLGGLLDSEDPNAVCAFVDTLGIECSTCASGVGAYCLSLLATGIAAGEVAGATIDPITEAEAAANCPE